MEWKTSKELKKELYMYTLKTADKLVLELGKKEKIRFIEKIEFYRK